MNPPDYAVFGHPISHSLSPRIHAAFGKQTGIALNYVAIDAPAESFAAALARFAGDGGRGASVTLPLKQDAFRLCTQTSDFARRAGAVNSLTRIDGTWHGD
ncbi:MAG: shikimate dehydrogenase, partial [Proteobacteria bacterium]|nr:shikimate dehydrogenase [Pseudomonadota bacterium]